MNIKRGGRFKTSSFFVESEMVPIIVLCLVILCGIIIPFKITGYGYLPTDDSLRHCAKAVSGKSWGEILVLRPDIKMDNHPGWHAILSALHKRTRWDTDGLVIFSVVSLFVLFFLVPVAFLKYPEAWPIALLVLFTANPFYIHRLLLGRPYIFTMAVLLILLFLWYRFKEKKFSFYVTGLFAILIAASTWIHGSWYLFLLPILSLFLAREFRAGIILTVTAFAGIVTGASLTGHPVLFLKGSLSHMLYAFSNHSLQRMLVSEFQPFSGDALIVVAVLGMLAWRKLRGAWNKGVVDNPVFILASLGWVLGFIVRRFWLDWGLPAVCVWMATEFQDVLFTRLQFLALRRILLTVVVLIGLFVATTNDINGRWTSNLTIEYLSQDNPKQASWLPAEGGIIYSDDMTIFYQTFFKNPHAPWRYILGFEPTMMPAEDLAIFRNIQWNRGAYQAFEPWVKKMTTKDRLIVRHSPDSSPKIEGLEWYYAATGIWIGRKQP